MIVVHKEGGLQEMVKEASRIEACQRSYDSEYSHEFSIQCATDVAFLKSGGNIEEAAALLVHIESATCSYLNNCLRMGVSSYPYGKLQGWVSVRRKQLKQWLPLQETFNRLDQRITAMRACRLSGGRIRLLLVVFRELKMEYQKFLFVVSRLEVVHAGYGWTERERALKQKEYEKDVTTSPYNLMREQVVCPWIDRTINDLARVNEMLDTVADCCRSSGGGDGDGIEHWMMLDDEDRGIVDQWGGGSGCGSVGGGSGSGYCNAALDSTVDVDSDDAAEMVSSVPTVLENPTLRRRRSGGMTTVGQALDTLRSDPDKFKAFGEMTRHMTEMMRLD